MCPETGGFVAGVEPESKRPLKRGIERDISDLEIELIAQTNLEIFLNHY